MSRPTNLKWIQCAICQKPIESITEEWNPSTDEFIYTVRCHGDQEQCTLSRAYFVTAHSIEGGMAFATPRIEQALKEE